MMLLLLGLTAMAGEEPTFWKNYWLNGRRQHLVTEAVPQPATGPLVLLVPGTTISPEFFAPMEARLRRGGYRTRIFAPPDLFTHSLVEGANDIGEEVEGLVAAGERDVIVVAQCDAGVAARYYAQVLGGSKHIRHLITFVSGHHGANLAWLAAAFTPYRALDDMRPGSPFMKTLDAAPFPEGWRMTSIYSCHDGLIRPFGTSRVDGATNVPLCDKRRRVDHFSGFWDPNVYDLIEGAVRTPAS